jgi:uncharacterized protein DUF4062
MQSVFISSIQRDYTEVRRAVRRAVESLGMRPLMAELAGASAASPQRALLDLVAQSDVFLLVMGPRYSDPTEREFEEARRLGKPIVVLRQEGPLEPEQERFLDRVAGGWRGGRLWGEFTDATDAGFAAVKALTNLREGPAMKEVATVARARALELATEGGRGSYAGRGSQARVVFVPLVAEPLLDAVALEQPDLAELTADLARRERIILHSVGIEPAVSRGGISLALTGSHHSQSGVVTVAPDGAVTCHIDVGGDDEQAGSRIDPTLLKAGIRRAGAFALRVWERIDPREAVQQVAVCVAILDAQYKVFGLPVGASTYSLGMTLPETVVAPEAPAIVRRADVADELLADRLVAEVRRHYADAGALAT